MSTRTPDEIKKGLECSDCRNCPYTDCSSYEECMVTMAADALAYIQQLEATNAELLTRCERLEEKCHQLERERDAAVDELELVDSPCDFCRHLKKYASDEPCSSCKHIARGEESRFEWRGVKEERA